jgi:hypothetical protein
VPVNVPPVALEALAVQDVAYTALQVSVAVSPSRMVDVACVGVEKETEGAGFATL